MSSIVTKSNKAEREIAIPMPDVLRAENVSDLVSILGEDLLVKTAMAQLTVGFRSHVRTKLESQTDGEVTYSDEAIAEMDFSDWKPEARTRKTAEEKAAEMLGKMTPEQIAAVMASIEA